MTKRDENIRSGKCKSAFLLAMFCLLAVMTANCQESPTVVIKTTAGDITIKLNAVKAPVTVANFLQFVDSKSYDGTIFHRVIADFMIQAGGVRADLSEVEESEDGILNEADTSGLLNEQGTISMARTDKIDSAGRQFFINTSDNTHLDHSSLSCTRKDEKKQTDAAARGLYRPLTCKGFGYAVFGHVVAGSDVVEKINLVDVEEKGGYGHLPRETITILAIVRL